MEKKELSEDYTSLPDEYNETWDLKKTPKTLVNEACQKLSNPKLRVEYVDVSKKPSGPFLCRLEVYFGAFYKEYIPDNTSKTKISSQHNAALQFVLTPPEWLRLTLGGDEGLKTLQEKYPVEFAKTFGGVTEEEKQMEKPQEKVEKVEENKEGEPKPKTEEEVSAEIHKLIQEMKDPMSFGSDIPEMPDCEDQQVISHGAPHFSFEEFDAEYKSDPSKFLDIFDNGDLLIKVINPGDKYPDTGAVVRIHFVARRGTDGKVFGNTLYEGKCYEFKLGTGAALPCLDWGVSTMKIGEEILLKSSYKQAYGEIGHPPLIPAKETLLYYIKLVDAKKFSPTEEEMKLIANNTPAKRIGVAKQLKETGNKFFEQKKFKLAIDHYNWALRNLKYKPELFKQLEKETRKEIKLEQCTLHGNLAAYHTEHSQWDEAITMCTKALKLNSNCVRILLLRSRAYSEIENFKQASNDYNQAFHLDPNNINTPDFSSARNRYKIKSQSYKERKRQMEAKMGGLK